MREQNIINPEVEDGLEEKLEISLRPQFLREYIGQNKVKENMKVYIEAAKKRKEPLDHVLLYGPPGLGKTTLAIASKTGFNTHNITTKYVYVFALLYKCLCASNLSILTD